VKLCLYTRKLNGDEDFSHYITNDNMRIMYSYRNCLVKYGDFDHTIDDDIIAYDRIYPTYKIGYFVFDLCLPDTVSLEDCEKRMMEIIPEVFL